MTAADPRVILTVLAALVVRDVKIQPEAVPVEGHRAVEISNLEYDSDEPVLLRHTDIILGTTTSSTRRYGAPGEAWTSER